MTTQLRSGVEAQDRHEHLFGKILERNSKTPSCPSLTRVTLPEDHIAAGAEPLIDRSCLRSRPQKERCEVLGLILSLSDLQVESRTFPIHHDCSCVKQLLPGAVVRGETSHHTEGEKELHRERT